MNGKVFLDTNVLVYAHDLDAGMKHTVAVKVVKDMWENRTGVLSTQVLQEFYINVTKKIESPISPFEAREIIKTYACWEIRENTSMSIIRASELEEKHHISFWDAMVVVAAYESKVDKILTENLNSGQIIEGILIENPFSFRTSGKEKGTNA
jgi:predicted nucleic acid-binding protein